jgi:hypothetical protein
LFVGMRSNPQKIGNVGASALGILRAPAKPSFSDAEHPVATRRFARRRSFLQRLTGATAQQERASSSVRRRTMTVALAS